MVEAQDKQDLSKTFISSDKLKNIFVYQTPSGKIKYNAHAMYLFINIHKKVKKYQNNKPIKITYKEIQDKLRISKSTVKRTLDYLSNKVNVIKRITRKLTRNVNNKPVFDRTELYILVSYENLNQLFKEKNEKFNFMNSKQYNDLSVGYIKENIQVPNVQKCTYYNSNNTNRSIKDFNQSTFNLEIKQKKFRYKLQTLDKFISSEKLLSEIQSKVLKETNVLIELSMIRSKINCIINNSTTQPKFYSEREFMKYMIKVINNDVSYVNGISIWNTNKELNQININQYMLDTINQRSGKHFSLISVKKMVNNILKSGRNPKFKNEVNFINYMSLVFTNEKLSEQELSITSANLDVINKIKNSQALTSKDILLKRLSLKLDIRSLTNIVNEFYIEVNTCINVCTLTTLRSEVTSKAVDVIKDDTATNNNFSKLNKSDDSNNLNSLNSISKHRSNTKIGTDSIINTDIDNNTDTNNNNNVSNVVLNTETMNTLKQTLKECFSNDYSIVIKQKDTKISTYNHLIQNLSMIDITSSVINILKETMGMSDDYSNNFDTWFSGSRVLLNKEREEKTEIKILSKNSISSKYLKKNFISHIQEAVLMNVIDKCDVDSNNIHRTVRVSECGAINDSSFTGLNVDCEFIFDNDMFIDGEVVLVVRR